MTGDTRSLVAARLRHALNGRVVASEVTVNALGTGYFRRRDWVNVAGEWMRVWNIDNRLLVLYVY